MISMSSYLRRQGMDRMRGPVNPSMNDSCGLLIKGFFSPPVFMMPYNPRYYINLLENYGLKKVKDLSPVFMMPYNPRYYINLLENYGLKKVKDLYAYYLSTLTKPDERLIRIGEKIKKRFNISLP